MIRALMCAVVVVLTGVIAAAQSDCVSCHQKTTPNIVSDWNLSKHSKRGIGCETCHGDQHHSAADVDKVRIPTPDTCGTCHEQQVAQFKAGKHSKAWVAMSAMPTIYYQPMALIEGMKGCGGLPSCYQRRVFNPKDNQK